MPIKLCPGCHKILGKDQTICPVCAKNMYETHSEKRLFDLCMSQSCKAYKEQYDRAFVSQMPLVEDAREARRQKISYGQLIARRKKDA